MKRGTTATFLSDARLRRRYLLLALAALTLALVLLPAFSHA